MKGIAVRTKRTPSVKKLNLSTKKHKPSLEKKNFPGRFQTPNVFRPQDDETTALGFLLRNRLHRTRKNAGPRVVVMPSLPATEGNVRINVLPPTHEEHEEHDEARSRKSNRSNRSNRNNRQGNVPFLVLSESVVPVEEPEHGGLRHRGSQAPLLLLPDGGVVPVEDVEDEQREQREQREEGEDLAMMLVCGGCGVAILSIVGSYYWLTRKIETPGLSW